MPSSTSKEEKVEKKSLEKIVEEFGGEIKDKPFDDVAVVEKAGETFTIYESGEILGGGLSVWTGESEEMTPDAEGNFHITNANQLKWMADKIINGEKNFGGITALKMSKEMMDGHKWEYFVLILSFIGWILLCVFIIPIIWVIPYIQTTQVMYYEELKKLSK